MESIQNLKIFDSPKLDTFPEIKGDMHRLEYLVLKSTGIREVPSSIGNLSGLTVLYLEGCEDLVSLPDSLCNLMNLRCLTLRGCKKLEKLPENIRDLQELYLHDASETAISQPHDELDRNILGGLPEELGSLRELDVSRSNISCLPKSFKGFFCLRSLNVQFCQNLNELPGELPPNLEELFADYHLALKSSKNLAINCLKLHRLGISNCGTVSSEQVNVFLQHFLTTCIQCDFHQRKSFLNITFPAVRISEFMTCIQSDFHQRKSFLNTTFPAVRISEFMTCIQSDFHQRKSFLNTTFPAVRIPELFDYGRFINQKRISIDLNPSWYTDKFMGFWICYGPIIALDTRLKATLVCKADPERKYSLKYNNIHQYCRSEYPFICCVYIPFETLWNASGNKEGKNPNDYYMLELSDMYGKEQCCWGIRLEYEKEAMSDTGHPKKKRKQ